jgi:N utilization substance protein A
MVSRDFVGALLQLNAEKQVSREQLIGAVEDGIQSAYRRVAGDEDIHVQIDAESGRIRVFRARLVVEEIEDELTQITVDDARRFDGNAKPGDTVETEQLDGDVFGRIGAQTAKQIVLQRIREVERDQVFDQFASREGELITGTVNRVEPRAIILDVGKNTEAILATTEQSALEHYRIGQNVKAFVLEVRPADLREPDA